MLYNKIEMTVFTEDILQDLFSLFEYETVTGTIERSKDELKKYALGVRDSILGISTGSYTCNREIAKQNVLEYFGVFYDAVNWYGISDKEVGSYFLYENWEWLDILCRKYIFDKYLDEFIDEYLLDDDDSI